MLRAIVVTAEPDARLLTPADTRAAWDLMPGPWRVDCRWLGPGEAWEALVMVETEAQAAEALRIVRERLAGRKVDINMVSGGKSRRKKLLMADMESTIIEQELIDELADYVGQRLLMAAMTERAMRGEIGFEQSLRDRVALLKGLDPDILKTLFDERVTLMPGAAQLVATMKRNGAVTALVSGGFSYFALRVSQRLGFDFEQANTLEIDRASGRIKGTVAEPILGPEAKKAALLRIASEKGMSPQETLAVGDGANDLEMIAAAGLGVAFRAKPKVRDGARMSANGAVIAYGALTALLYLQGYRREEFATPRP